MINLKSRILECLELLKVHDLFNKYENIEPKIKLNPFDII